MEMTDTPNSSKKSAEWMRVAEDFRVNTLEPMGSHFRQLIYLASLRDNNTARYHHPGLEAYYGSDSAAEGMRQCHIRIFEELIAQSLRDQTRDFIQFFESLREERLRMIESWQQLHTYQVLLPENCHPLARQLFENNVEVMLRILRETDLWALLDEPKTNPAFLQ